MNNDKHPDENTSKELYKLFQDPTSKFFLETNTERIYEQAKEDSRLYPITRDEIEKFKHSIETISRSFESRTLRSRQRHLRYRKWITYGPLNILLGLSVKYTRCIQSKIHSHTAIYIIFFSKIGDLCFLPPIKKDGKRFTVLVLLDAFSRLVHLSHLQNATAQTTITAFENGLRFFGVSETQTYYKFTSDRG